MSYNLVNPTTGDLTRVAGNSNIVDTAIETDSTWSSKKINAYLGELYDIINGFKNVQIVSSLGSVKLKEIIQSEFPKLQNGRGMIRINDGTTLYCGTYIKYSNTQGSTTFTNVEGTSYIWTIRGDTVTLQEIATMDKVDSIPLIYNQNTDILAYALTCPQEKRTLVRIYSANATNNPYGVSTDTDFIYEIDKINFNDLFITVRAKDVKNNREFINTKNETKWSGWKELATMDKVVNSIIRESKSTLYNLNNVDNIEVAINITKSGYKPIAVSLFNSGTHLWFAQGIYFDDTVCNLSLRGATPTSATNAECKVLVTYIKTS